MHNPKETYFNSLDGISVHYDRDRNSYGSEGKPYKFYCRKKLKNVLEFCFSELFNVWRFEKPKIILSAGTIGDGENAHGRGFAFDLDGFIFQDHKLLMDSYKSNSQLYLGINAHMFLHFSQVLSNHYPAHHDHIHVDFNRRYFRYKTESNAQTFFLQAILTKMFDSNLGNTGIDNDGVDGIYGYITKIELKRVLKVLNLDGKGGIGKSQVWKEFLLKVRNKAFEL